MLHRALCAVLFMMLVGGCSLEQELSRTPRTAVEQVLLTQAVTRALNNLTVQLPAGVNVELDATGHHVNIGFSQAGGGAAFAGFAATIAGVDTGLERVV